MRFDRGFIFTVLTLFPFSLGQSEQGSWAPHRKTTQRRRQSPSDRQDTDGSRGSPGWEVLAQGEAESTTKVDRLRKWVSRVSSRTSYWPMKRHPLHMETLFVHLTSHHHSVQFFGIMFCPLYSCVPTIIRRLDHSPNSFSNCSNIILSASRVLRILMHLSLI